MPKVLCKTKIYIFQIKLGRGEKNLLNFNREFHLKNKRQIFHLIGDRKSMSILKIIFKGMQKLTQA